MKIAVNSPRGRTSPELAQKIRSWVVITVLVLMVSSLTLFFFSEPASTFGEQLAPSSKQIESHPVTRPLHDGPVDFFTLLNSDQFSLLLISVKDDAVGSLTDSVKNAMKGRGSVKFGTLAVRGGFVAVIENGRVVAEEVNNDGVASLSYKNFYVESSGYLHGNTSKISFRNRNHSPNLIGANVVGVTWDNALESFSFDFHNYPNPLSQRFKKYGLPNDRHNVHIIIKDSEYAKLRQKREEALKIGILLTSDKDLVPAKIEFGNNKYDAEIRLKGDWVDHLKAARKWSFRVNLKENQMLFGMSKFNIQDPATRNYIGEWIFHKALKREGITALRYSFVNVDLVIKGQADSLFYLGTYAVEESFDKFLIENNNRRAGVIVKLNEDLLWTGTAQARKVGLNADLGEYQLSNYSNITVLPFSQKSVLNDAAFSRMFDAARNSYYDFIRERLPISEVFDVPKLAKYNAIVCLLGATHALELHNQRLYYNPVTTRFEPIGFDGAGGAPLTTVRPYYRAEQSLEYMSAFAQALETVSKKEYLDSLFASLDDMEKNTELLKSEFPGIAFDKETLYQNQRVIDKELHPSTAIHPFLVDLNDEAMSVRLRSITPFPIEILNVSYKGKRILGEMKDEYVLMPKKVQLINFRLPRFYKNLFVSKKSKKAVFSKASDLKDLVITYRTLGTNKVETAQILPWQERDDHFYKDNLYFLRKSSFKNFDFLIVDERNKTITFETRHVTVKEDLIFPKGYRILGNGNLVLDITNNAKIVSYSPIIFHGTKEEPIRIFSSDDTGQGLLLIEAAGPSELKYVEITGLTNPRNPYWNVTGTLNFYESPVDLSNVVIQQNQSEDALNIIRTRFSMRDVIFLNIHADAFDGDFVKGTIFNTHFENVGNDGIDISGSTVTIRSITVINAGDKGLSAGENSIINAKNVLIGKSEIGMASKDRSTINIDSVRVINCRLGITAFQKKQEFGPAEIEIKNGSLENCYTPYLIEDRSRLLFNNKIIETTPRVIDKLYGAEYGKISE